MGVLVALFSLFTLGVVCCDIAIYNEKCASGLGSVSRRELLKPLVPF